MSKRAVALWCLVLGSLLATACGADASADASDQPAKPKARPAEPATTTTTTPPPPYSFDGSVPPPPLVNTGTDYEAIIRSLDAYSHWLYAHNPDASLIKELAVIGTPLYDTYLQDLQALSRDVARGYDSESHLESVAVTSQLANAVTLAVTYSDETRVLVKSNGDIADEQVLPSHSTWNYLLNADAAGRWRIASAYEGQQGS